MHALSKATRPHPHPRPRPSPQTLSLPALGQLQLWFLGFEMGPRDSSPVGNQG